MLFFNRLTAVLLVAAMIGPVMPIQARTRKGDKFLAEGRVHEQKKEWDAALQSYEQALSEDPGDVLYQMAVQKARFQDGQVHIDRGQELRAKGQLGEGLIEFQRAYAVNPGSAIAVQEIQTTQQMIQRERKRVEDTGKEATPEVRGLTPVEQYKKGEQQKLDRILGVPELRPLNPAPINLKMNNKTKVLFETVGKYAGINILWDPEYQPPAKDGFNIELEDSTIEQSLDYLAVLTKSYWKPLSPNAIFITNDNPNKRRDYEEQVTKVFYLQNVSTTQELQEVVNAIRTIADINKVYPYNSQFAVIVRGEADRVELAQKIVSDLDKAKSEVVVDIMVIEANSTFTRSITTALASTGLNVPFTFNPRSSIQVQQPSSGSGSGTGTGDGTGTGTGDGSSTTGSFIPLSKLGHLSSADFATTLPSALLQAAMSDARTKVLQAPQLRSVDNIKATLKIGEREPTASGSFQPGVGGVGINPLVNTQFTYLDVGVNVELLPRVMDNGEVYMHIDLDISNVSGTVNLGGIDQPIIGQRKVAHDIRMRDGEVGLLGGLINQQESKTVTGIPGLSSIPLLRRLFSGEDVQKARGELMIVLIPHIIRRSEITETNLRAVAVGNQITVKLNHSPRQQEARTNPVTPAPAGMTPGNPPKPVPGAAADNPGMVPPSTTGPPATAPPATAPPTTAPPATMPPATAAAPTTQPAQGATRVYFNPGQLETTVGKTVSVTVSLDNGTDVASVPMIIQFDPKVLKLNDVTQGGYFSGGTTPPLFTKNIQNDAGRASVMLNAPTDGPGITAPTGTLVTLTFQAVEKGATNVTIPFLTVRNSQGQVLTSGTPQLSVNVK